MIVHEEFASLNPLMSRTAQLGAAILGLLVIVLLANWRRDRGGK